MTQIEERIAKVAEEAAREAGALLKEHALKERRVEEVLDHDVKLEVDFLCEEAILQKIRSAFPGHGILAEESGEDRGGEDYLWIVDPLDGTVNYYFGLPYYCISIACYAMKEGQASDLEHPVSGVVYAPPTDELFVAIKGRGAFLNGRPIKTPHVGTLSEAVMGMGFGKTDELGRHMVDRSSHLSEKVRKIRCLGAAAYDLANVACGRLTGFFEKGLRTWDIAAGAVILAEAGGVMTCEEFAPTRWRLLASATGIHEEAKAILFPP